jgi:DNA-binding transcriptional ArsR family regulator
MADEYAAREVWLLMSDLVLDHTRRREVSEALGMTFGRVRAIRRLARGPLSMGEFATALGIDRPNATTLVDDLEAQGLARRREHPTDRRAKLVEATRRLLVMGIPLICCCSGFRLFSGSSLNLIYFPPRFIRPFHG